MALRRGFQGRIPIRSKRMTSWGVGPQSLEVLLTASAKQLWTAAVVLVRDTKVTIVRIRGMVHIMQTNATSIGDGFSGALGIGVMSGDAFNAGVASLPGPVTDSEWDGWMWHSFFDVRQRTAIEADGVNSGSGDVRIEIDTKAMRKFEDTEALVGVIEVTEQGTATAEFWADSRILLKLS